MGSIITSFVSSGRSNGVLISISLSDLAHAAGAPLHELAEQTASLEEVFFALTSDTLPAQAPERPA